MAGLTVEGFEIKTLQEILSEVETTERAEIDPGLDVSSEEPLGQLNGIACNLFAELWDLAQTAHNVIDPTKNEGINLDNICAVTGTRRQKATRSYVDCDMSLAANTVVPAGSIIAQGGNPNRRAYLVGQVTNGNFAKGDVTAIGGGTYVGRFYAETPGPVTMAANTMNVIVTPVTGWSSVVNATDGILGLSQDSDAKLRQRREEELQRAGGSTTGAMKADLLALAAEGVQTATVRVNRKEVSYNGLPPKSFECVVYDGQVPAVPNDTIAQVILDTMPAGIQPYGITSGNAVDEEGNTVVVPFTRPTPQLLYITVNVGVSLTVAEKDSVKSYIATYMNKILVPGKDVIALDAQIAAKLANSKIEDVPEVYLGFSPSPASPNNIPIDVRNIAIADSSRVSVLP